MDSRVGRARFDPAALVLLVMVVFICASFAQLTRTWNDASRGIILYERARRDMMIDAGLVAAAAHLHANQTLANALRAETVLVAQRRSDGHAFEGAGVIVGERDGTLIIITARHVVSHPGRTIVAFSNGEVMRYASRVVRAAHDDLALVFVRARSGTRYDAARIARADFASGELATIVGHPNGVRWIASAGIADPHIHETLIYCRTCNLGDSGAGAFDMRGRLHGIVIRRYVIRAPSTTGHLITVTAFGTVRADRIRNFLRQHHVA